MRATNLLPAMLMAICAAAYSAEAPETLAYQSFIDDAQAGRVKSVEISSGPGLHDIKVTTVRDGQEVTYVVGRPYKPSEDPLFVDFLKKNQIQSKFVEEDFTNRSFFPFLGIFGLLMYGVPVAMLVLLIILVVRTARVHDAVKSMEFFLKLEFAKADPKGCAVESPTNAASSHNESRQPD